MNDADRRMKATAWFESLRDSICAAFEAIEQDYRGPLSDRAPGRFVRTPCSRAPASAPASRAEASARVAPHASTLASIAS